MPQTQRDLPALTTLAFPIILMGIVFALPDLTGGELGISGIARLAGSRVTDYYIAVVVMLGLSTIMWKITDSNTGIIFHAIRRMNWLSGPPVSIRLAINF